MPDQKKTEPPKVIKLVCPQCQTPMISRSVQGFGIQEKMICPNTACATNRPISGWCS